MNPSEDTADQPINLFEAAAQAGRGAGSGARSGGGGAGAGTGTGAGAGTGSGAGGSSTGGLSNLDFLRNNSQFQQLRQVVQQQPQMLEPILQQVGAGNPQLAQLIAQNRDQFLQLLAEDIGDDAPLPPGAQAISVTEEERDAIERVSDFFPPRPKPSPKRSLRGSHVGATETKVPKLTYVWSTHSSADSASTENKSSRRTLRATRTRNSQRISCSSSRMTLRILDDRGRASDESRVGRSVAVIMQSGCLMFHYHSWAIGTSS